MKKYVVLMFSEKEFDDVCELMKRLQSSDSNSENMTKEIILGVRAFENAIEKGAEFLKLKIMKREKSGAITNEEARGLLSMAGPRENKKQP